MPDYFWFHIFVFLNATLLIALALNISRMRIQNKVANGDAGDVRMKKAIRAHGNGVEHVLVAGLIVLALVLCQSPKTLLAIIVLGFTFARALHALGMLGSQFNMRRIGAGLTYLFEMIGVASLLYYGVLA